MKSTDAYKMIGSQKWEDLKYYIRHDVAHTIFHVGIQKRKAPKPESPMAKAVARSGNGSKQKAVIGGKKIGRNAPCPCGSGKKYKYCCGR